MTQRSITNLGQDWSYYDWMEYFVDRDNATYDDGMTILGQNWTYDENGNVHSWPGLVMRGSENDHSWPSLVMRQNGNDYFEQGLVMALSVNDLFMPRLVMLRLD